MKNPKDAVQQIIAFGDEILDLETTQAEGRKAVRALDRAGRHQAFLKAEAYVVVDRDGIVDLYGVALNILTRGSGLSMTIDGQGFIRVSYITESAFRMSLSPGDTAILHIYDWSRKIHLDYRVHTFLDEDAAKSWIAERRNGNTDT